VNGTLQTSYENKNIVYLPSHYSYKNLYKYFLLSEKLDSCDISDRTFENLWKDHEKYKYLKIRDPKKDSCDSCSIFKTSISDLTEEEFDESYELMEEYSSHISDYRKMKSMYKDDELVSRSNDPDRPVVLSFDNAQNVCIPHKPDQPGSWYFISMKKVYQFGIVDEELDKHTHLLYTDEDTGKGPDEVCSLISWYLDNCHIRKSKKLILWADNCGGQNKNNTVIQFIHNWLEPEDMKRSNLNFK